MMIQVLLFVQCFLIEATQYYASPDATCGNQCTGQSAQSPYNSIQQALSNGLKYGGNLILLPGNYNGSSNVGLTFQSGAFNISSQAGAQSTILDCQGQSVGMIMYSGTFTLSGITIQNCVSTYSGGGLQLASGSYAFSNITLFNNTAQISGGGIYINPGSMSCLYCNFTNNMANQSGGALYVFSSSVSLDYCLINENYANQIGGGIFVNQSSISLYNSAIQQNSILNGLSYSNSITGSQTGCNSSNYMVYQSYLGSSDMNCTQCSVMIDSGSENNTSECYVASQYSMLLKITLNLVLLMIL